jgi:Ni/Co efflux regulator RcnB
MNPGALMKSALVASALLALAVTAAPAFADEHDGHDGHDGHAYVHHDDWKKGSRMRDEDWKRGQRVDYHQRHLRAPPRGYEWREVDGNYVLAAVATGVIASVVAASIAGR